MQMWYQELYNKSIKVIKNSKKRISATEYKKMAKELNLLSPESLRFITNLEFVELVRTVRKKKQDVI